MSTLTEEGAVIFLSEFINLNTLFRYVLQVERLEPAAQRKSDASFKFNVNLK